MHQPTGTESEQKPTQNFPQPEETEYVLHRRFDRMGRLVGDEAMLKLFKTHVMVIGLGGVGSWAAESLARSGMGHITLADYDDICITNANRQVHALQGLVGRKKVDVMAERLKKINPQANVQSLHAIYQPETSEEFFALKPDYIIDAIDNISYKCHLLAECKRRGVKVITSGGSGGRMDPLKVQIKDLAKTHNDALTSAVRKYLRKTHEFPSQNNYGIPCVFSDEPVQEPKELKYDKGMGFQCVCPQNDFNWKTCEKRNVILGTASFVTGTFGFTLASWVVSDVLKGLNQQPSPGVN